jgi:tRNA (cytidine/uridine-2'-O-)-methyltransferase
MLTVTQIKLALFQPDIPQNTGTMMRLAACLGVHVDIIEPCGFLFDDRRMRRAGMDYLQNVDYRRHNSWPEFQKHRGKSSGRLLLLTTSGDLPYCDFHYAADDTILMGRESAGVPVEVHEAADARLIIPMTAGARSLNVALAASMVLGEALRQTGQYQNFKQERPPCP